MANHEQKSISKKDMHGFLQHLGLKRALVCPVDTGKVIEFQKVGIDELDKSEGIILDAVHLSDEQVSYKSIKEYYFPQTELMFTFKNDDVTDNKNIPGYAIFGARPCDLEALRVMNVVYSTGKYADPFFHRRFEANFLIAIGCKNTKPECFCQEIGVDKEFSDFCDVMLSDNGDSYSVEYLSKKGKQELDGYLGCQGDGSPDNICRNITISCQENRPPDNRLALDVDRDDADYFDIIDWVKVTEACKGCGICTYICPTCYCFDFKDVSKKGIAERYKCWDSCMYPKFTLHASGHNPRENRYERYRQRVLHKYKYVPNNFDGFVACTGCGRCVRSCPVGVNIKNILMSVIKNISTGAQEETRG